MKYQAKIFKGLSDETRLRILALLLQGEQCVCELIAALEAPQSTISRHLAYLKKSGWVEGRRQGAWMYYRLNDKENELVRDLKLVLEKYLSNDSVQVESMKRLNNFQGKHKFKVC